MSELVECPKCGGPRRDAGGKALEYRHRDGCPKASSLLSVYATPTPARSEAAGGEERIAERDREAIQRAQAYDDSVGFLQRRCADLLRRAEEAESELASLRQQLAAARENGERWRWALDHRRELYDLWQYPESDTHEGLNAAIDAEIAKEADHA